MAREVYDKATFFLFVAAVLGAAVWQWRRHPWSHCGLLVGMAAGMIVLFNGFLVVTYVVLFPAVWRRTPTPTSAMRRNSRSP